MNGIDFWRLADELTLIQASLLICGYDPTELQNKVRYERESKPEGFVAILHALSSATKGGLLDYRESRVINDNDGEYYVDDDLALIHVEKLKAWMKAKGLREHFFFFPEEPEGEFLSKSHPRYSPKLAAAVRAWLAMDDESLHEKTPKQSAIVWLRRHSAEFDLNDKEGKLKDGTIEEIAKIVNWNPKGGAPATPSELGSEEPKAGNKPSAPSNEMFSVLTEKTPGQENENPFDLDSEIPF